MVSNTTYYQGTIDIQLNLTLKWNKKQFCTNDKMRVILLRTGNIVKEKLRNGRGTFFI